MKVSNIDFQLLQVSPIAMPPDGSFGARIVRYGHELISPYEKCAKAALIPDDSLFQQNSKTRAIGVILYAIKRGFETPLEQSAKAVAALFLIALGNIVYKIEQYLPENSQADRLEKAVKSLGQAIDQITDLSLESQLVVDNVKTTTTKLATILDQIVVHDSDSKRAFAALNKVICRLNETITSVLLIKEHPLETRMFELSVVVDAFAKQFATFHSLNMQIIAKEQALLRRVNSHPALPQPIMLKA